MKHRGPAPKRKLIKQCITGVAPLLILLGSYGCGVQGYQKGELSPSTTAGGGEIHGEVWIEPASEALTVFARLENRGDEVARVSTNAHHPLGLRFYDAGGRRKWPLGDRRVSVVITLAEGIYDVPPGEELLLRADHHYFYLALTCLEPGTYTAEVILRVRSPAMQQPDSTSLRFHPVTLSAEDLAGPQDPDCAEIRRERQ